MDIRVLRCEHIHQHNDTYIEYEVYDNSGKSHSNSRPPLATTYRGVTGSCDPIRSSVGPHAEHAIIDGGMVHFV